MFKLRTKFIIAAVIVVLFLAGLIFIESFSQKPFGRGVLISIFALVMLAVLGFCFYITRSVTGPVNEAVNLFGEISKGKGNLTVRLDEKKDSGLVSKWLNEFVGGVQIILKDIRSAFKEFSHLTMKMKESLRGIQSSAQTQHTAVEDISSSIEEMHYSIKSVSEGVDELLESTESASTSSLEVSTTVADVSDNTERLTSSIDTVSSSISEIAASIKEVASNVDILSSETGSVVSAITEMKSAVMEVSMRSQEQAYLSEKVKSAAVTIGLEAVNNNKQGMNKIQEEVKTTSTIISGLGERSKEIGKIVSVINGIAETTNLLALNAAILAVQAGEYGKGFAVVSDQVKVLAQKTAESTKEISELIKHVQSEVSSAMTSMSSTSQRVAEGVKLSEDTGEALSKIVESADASLEMSQNVERSTEEQAKSIGYVAESISKVNDMVDGIKKATEEQKSASQEILNATEDINNIKFKVKQATTQQSKEMTYISKVITEVAHKMQAVAKAASEQKKASEMILRAVETIKENSKNSVALFLQLEDTSANLDMRAVKLGQKIDNFRV